ncbi:unnamed protein product [Nippostrongylus brasiliensis]|uniref:Uncharacterized protein n=1 Tax=Nippostrongylus brasiliensis TaxID=27835 RepID=A0A0N4YC92_NIPBR|nr:unnamed protein product [Nippostrongylus brasiliensis]
MWGLTPPRSIAAIRSKFTSVAPATEIEPRKGVVCSPIAVGIVQLSSLIRLPTELIVFLDELFGVGGPDLLQLFYPREILRGELIFSWFFLVIEPFPFQ